MPRSRDHSRPTQNSGRNSGGIANLRPFEKGCSGNPGGRPKGLARAVREVPVEQGSGDGAVLLAKIFWRIVSDPKEKTENVIAAGRFIAERGWGKPAEFVAVEEADPLEMGERQAAELAEALDARLDELAARRRARESAATGKAE